MSAVIDIVKLYKRFGHVRALDGLDLAGHEGEVHGFLGPERCRQVDDDPRTTRRAAGRRRARPRLLGRRPVARRRRAAP